MVGFGVEVVVDVVDVVVDVVVEVVVAASVVVGASVVSTSSISTFFLSSVFRFFMKSCFLVRKLSKTLHVFLTVRKLLFGGSSVFPRPSSRFFWALNSMITTDQNVNR